MDSAKSWEWLVKITLSSFIETATMSHPHVDKGGLALVQHSLACMPSCVEKGPGDRAVPCWNKEATSSGVGSGPKYLTL